MSCVVPGCYSHTSKLKERKGELSFHLFPKYEKIKEKWIEAAARPGWYPPKSSSICSVHFEQKCFQHLKINKKLFPWAVPTLKIPIIRSSETAASGCEEEGNQELDIPEGKELIVRVYCYLENEYEHLKQSIGHSCDLSPLANILKRTAAATGVSEPTVTSLLERDPPSDEEISDDDGSAKRLRLDIDLDEDLDQKQHFGQEQFETKMEQEHYGPKEQDNCNTTETFTIKYEEEDYDEQMEHSPLEQTHKEHTQQEQTHQEQTPQEQTPQKQTSQEQNKGTEQQKQYGVRIKQEIDDEASRPSGHILASSEPVTVKIEPEYCGTTSSVKREPPDQQSSNVDPLSLESS